MEVDDGRLSGVGDETHLAWCHEVLQRVSRTFALTVKVLEEPMASEICLGYLLCRIPDTIEDASHIPPEEQAALLRLYARVMDPEDDPSIDRFVAEVTPWIPSGEELTDDWRVVADASRVMQTYAALSDEARESITPQVIELTEGMAMFLERHAETDGLRIKTRAELDEYCHYAAGTVGTLITNLLTRGEMAAARRRRLYETAESFGLLLQLVNISKDVHDDYADERNVYLPKSWFVDVGVGQEEVVNPEHREGAVAVVNRTVEHARSFLDEAEAYLELMPLDRGNTLAAWGVPFLLAIGTLRELAADPAEALTERSVKVSREEVHAVTAAMRRADREALGEFRSIIAHQPFHQAVPQVHLE